MIMLYYFWMMTYCWCLKGSIRISSNLILTVKNGNLEKKYLVY